MKWVYLGTFAMFILGCVVGIFIISFEIPTFISFGFLAALVFLLDGMRRGELVLRG
jgi:hypothetical protein